MESSSTKTGYNILVFVTWTVTSFLCHQFGKTFLNTWTDEEPSEETKALPETGIDVIGQLAPAGVLTLTQLAFCLLLVYVEKTDSSPKSLAKVYHALATLATNSSMALMASSSTFAIKMMEPVTSAVVQFLLLGTPLSPVALSSLPIIVGGSIAFAGNPLAMSTISNNTMPGMVGAFVSNIVLAFRNVEIKKMTTKSNSLPLKLRVGRQRVLLPLAVVSAALSVTLFLESYDIVGNGTTESLLYAVISGIFHVVYSYVSTALVLTQISVVSHAVANIMKRLLVVLLLYLFGRRTATVGNFLGLVVCTGGLLLYAWDKTRSKPEIHVNGKGTPKIKSSRKTSIVVTFTFILVLLITCFGIFPTLSPRHMNLFSPRAKTPQLQPCARPINRSRHEIRSFEAGAFVRPPHKHLQPALEDLPGALSPETLRNLQTPSHHNPGGANFISKKLSTSSAITKEAQRLHFSVIGKELEHFKYAFLFDIASFENKGDPAITIGEIYFLSRMNIEVKYYCSAPRCTDKKLSRAKTLSTNYTSSELVILVHGGGNIIGYALNDVTRFKIIDLFPSFKILIFPQSIWIRQRKHPHVSRTAKHYCCHPNLTIVLRDALSYKIAKTLYNGTTRLLMVPDMAFQIGHVPRFMSPVFDIMWIKRKDGETPSYKPPKSVPKHLKVHVSDWWKWHTPGAASTLEKAYYIATNGFFYLQRGRVVITDRLHGHIMSVLMDIPHVLIDNKAKKLSAYHNTWTRSLTNTVITDDPSKALGLAIELLKKYNETLPPVMPYLNLREDFSHPAVGVPDTSYP